MSNRKALPLETFEQRIVLGSARVLPLILAAVATLMLAGSAAALIYSFVPSIAPKELAPVSEPPPVKLSRADIEAFLRTKAESQASAAKQSAAGAATTPAPSDAAVVIANELHALRTRTARLQLPWADQFRTICLESYFGVCIRERRLKVASGVGDAIRPLLARWDDSEGEETVEIEGRTYRVNPSRRGIKVEILKEVQEVLEGATPSNARAIFDGWVELRTERENARAAKYKQESDRVRNTYEAARADYEATVALKEWARTLSFIAAGLALGALMLFGLILAVLAVERHTRVLEDTRLRGTARGGTVS